MMVESAGSLKTGVDSSHCVSLAVLPRNVGSRINLSPCSQQTAAKYVVQNCTTYEVRFHIYTDVRACICICVCAAARTSPISSRFYTAGAPRYHATA